VTVPLRILSWNIRKAVGLDWRRRPDRCVRVLNELQPDIALLQEADKRLGERPAALPRAMVEEAGYHAVGPEEPTVSLGWHGNAILVRDGLEVQTVKTLVLPGLEPRGALMAELKVDGRPLAVMGAHLGLRRRDRRRQVPLLLEHLHAPDRPALLGGDMNEWSVKPSTLGVDDEWRMLIPGPSFHASRPTLRLDRFIIDHHLRVRDMGVARDGEVRRASDHLPIWLDLTL
jgi:endonuclease/exonuclease/phosphatase family metal-dependent hydrolase